MARTVTFLLVTLAACGDSAPWQQVVDAAGDGLVDVASDVDEDPANLGEVPSSPPEPFDLPDAPPERPIDVVDADLTVAVADSESFDVDGNVIDIVVVDDVAVDVVGDIAFDVVGDVAVDVVGDVAVDVVGDLADSSGDIADDIVGLGDGDGDVNDGILEVVPDPCADAAVGCQGNGWVTCDPETGVVFAAICSTADPCTVGACLPDVGCVETPADCSDGDPCTVDSCATVDGCLHEPVECPEGQVCDAGVCICPVACPDQECGVDSCGAACGMCEAWEACDAGACNVEYPPPPYGGWAGDVAANHGFTNPADLSQVSLSEWWGEGQLLLLTFSAGWCIVCKNDVAVFNEWLGNCWDDGLRVVEVLYENPDQTPATASYANGWAQTFDAQYPVLIDNATLGADGEAEGGVLESFLLPNGPGEEGYMPIPVLIDTGTMEIVFADTGMNKPLFHALIKNYLGVETCWD